MDTTAAVLAKALATEIAGMVKAELEHLVSHEVQPVLLTVKQAAVYLGRSEQWARRKFPALLDLARSRVPEVRAGRHAGEGFFRHPRPDG